MSYEILYGRQFLSLGNDTYLPLILSGSNNCTMYHNGREIRERHWWAFGSFGSYDPIVKSKEGWIRWMQERVESNPDGEWFMRGGKWLLGSDMVKWMESGIKSARTIEEIVSRIKSQSLHCSITVYDKTKSYGSSGYQREENRKFIRATEELIKWIDEFEERRKTKSETESVYANIEFSGIEPLRLGVKSSAQGPCICKIGNCYLSDYAVTEKGSSHSYGPDISEALVFDSAADFEEKTKGLVLPVRYRLVSANPTPKEFVIKLDDGCRKGEYVLKKTSRNLRLTYSSRFAKRFTSEKTAQSYIDKMLAGRFPGCKSFVVEKIGA